MPNYPRRGPLKRPGSARRMWVPSQPTPPTVSRVAVIREYPPDKMACRIDAPNGARGRWAEDEPLAENAMSGITLGDEMPGGSKDAGGVLARDPRLDFRDSEAFERVKFYLPGVAKVWEGYLDKAPEVSGDQMSISPGCVGNQKHLEGNNAIKLGFIDSDVTKWSDPSLARRQYLLSNNFKLTASVETGLSSLDPEGTSPGVVMDFNNVEGPAATEIMAGEADYYGEGIDIGEVKYDYRQLTAFAKEALWETNVALGVVDTFKVFVVGLDHDRATALQQSVSTSKIGYKFARVRDARSPSGGVAQLKDVTAFQNLRVIGRHGLTPKGTWPKIGFTARQMLLYGVPLCASPLRVTEESIEDDGYVIPQAWYSEGSMAAAVQDIVKYGLLDWFVYDDLLFEYRWPGTYGNFWKTTMASSNLNELGVDSSRLWESIVVSYMDVDGTTRTVGPPGSGATFEYAELRLTDPDHPAVRAKLTRRDVLDLRGIGTPETAKAVGIRFLEEANLLNRSGSATLSGYVLDRYGVFWPAACVKSGDWISFTDASDTSYRKIVNKNYAHDSRAAEIDVDAPPSGLEALLERLQAGLIQLGVGA